MPTSPGSFQDSCTESCATATADKPVGLAGTLPVVAATGTALPSTNTADDPLRRT